MIFILKSETFYFPLERCSTNIIFKFEYSLLLSFSTQVASGELETRHLQEDHDRLMERHSALLQEMAAKELTARQKQEQLVQLASQVRDFFSKNRVPVSWFPNFYKKMYSG